VSTRGPDFDELVGEGLDRGERRRLLRVHELLVAAGPPPELPESAAPPDVAAEVVPFVRPRRRRGALVAVAAALGLFLFAVGVLVGTARDEPGTFDVVTMVGTPAAADATASIELFDADGAGNWPMEISVAGLPPAADGATYELWLTSGGEPTVLCGSFLTEPDGSAVVPMNAPYRLSDFDGWIVVEEGSTTPLLTT
jgi:hypothetical protein